MGLHLAARRRSFPEMLRYLAHVLRDGEVEPWIVAGTLDTLAINYETEQPDIAAEPARVRPRTAADGCAQFGPDCAHTGQSRIAQATRDIVVGYRFCGCVSYWANQYDGTIPPAVSVDTCPVCGKPGNPIVGTEERAITDLRGIRL